MKTLEEVLEEVTPQPDPDFVAEMERRMEQGFPAPAGRRRVPRLRLPDVRPRALAGVTAAAVLALLVSVSLLGGGSDPRRPDTPIALEDPAALPTDGSGGGESLSREPAATPRRGAAPMPDTATGAQVAPSPPLPPRGEQVAPDAQPRRVERSAQITLAADPGEFDRLADSIFRTAERRDGFVLRSSFTQGEDAPSGGFFELRVPTAELQPTLNELSRLATVRARSESGSDVTGSFVSLRDRLRTAQAERKSLLRRLELAETDRAAAAIRRRLEIVGRKVTSLRTQFLAARERTEFATVFVELVDEAGGAAESETDEALDDAVGYLEDILNFLIRAGGLLLPVAIAGLVGWLVATIVRRRARDRGLA